MAATSSYRDLLVWQEAMDFVVAAYRATEKFPKSEQFGLANQIRRAAVSIPSNLAEGQKRSYNSEFIQFCRIAYGSSAELDTQLILSVRLGLISKTEYDQLAPQLKSITMKLNRLIQSLGNRPRT